MSIKPIGSTMKNPVTLLVICLSLISPFDLVQASSEKLTNQIWQAIEKAESKLNKGLPRYLAKDLWIEKVEVLRDEKLVRYVGLIKNNSVEKLNDLNVDKVQSRAQKNTIKFLCGNKASEKFLKVLSIVDGEVEYQFFLEEKEGYKEFMKFKVNFNDCESENTIDIPLNNQPTKQPAI